MYYLFHVTSLKKIRQVHGNFATRSVVCSVYCSVLQFSVLQCSVLQCSVL